MTRVLKDPRVKPPPDPRENRETRDLREKPELLENLVMTVLM